MLQVGIHTVRQSSGAADDGAIKVTLQGTATFGSQNIWFLGFVVALPLAWSPACASTAGEHQGSQSTIMLAAVRFSLAIVAFKLQSPPFGSEAWKRAIRFLCRRNLSSAAETRLDL